MAKPKNKMVARLQRRRDYYDKALAGNNAYHRPGSQNKRRGI